VNWVVDSHAKPELNENCLTQVMMDRRKMEKDHDVGGGLKVELDFYNTDESPFCHPQDFKRYRAGNIPANSVPHAAESSVLLRQPPAHP
jgi:hypothetical protein